MSMQCKDVMTEKPVCSVPDESAQRVAQVMKEQNVGAIPVCDSRESKRLIGVVTDRDIALRVVAEGRDPAGTQVGDIMSREVFCCGPEDSIENALKTMTRQQVRRILVVDQDRCMLGIIAQADIATRLRAPEQTAEVVTEVSKPSTLAGGA